MDIYIHISGALLYIFNLHDVDIIFYFESCFMLYNNFKRTPAKLKLIAAG